VLVRAHVAASLTNASGEFVVDRWRSCTDVGSLARRRVDYVDMLVSHAQRSDHVTSFLGCELDVPVSHAFFVHGAAAQLSLRHVRSGDGRHSLESLTVSDATRLLSLCRADQMMFVKRDSNINQSINLCLLAA